MSQFPVDLPPTMLRTTLYTNKLIGNIKVIGNITSNIIIAENIYGNLTSNNWYPGNISGLTVNGNVTASYFIGNGALLSGINATSLPTAANIDIVGNVSAPGNVNVAGQVNVTGNVTGNYFIGNGALLSGINATSLPTAANIDIVGNVSAPGNVNVAGQVNVTGNVTAAYFLGNGALLTGVTSTLPIQANLDIIGNVTAPGNVVVAGQVNVTGNVTGDYFFGNGSQLTDITPKYTANGTTISTSNLIFTTDQYFTIDASNSTSLILSAVGVNTGGNLVVLSNAGYIQQTNLNGYLVVPQGYVANTQVRLALAGGDAPIGSLVQQVDNGNSYLLTSSPSNIDVNWLNFTGANFPVNTVFGRTGDVLATFGDYLDSFIELSEPVGTIPAGNSVAQALQSLQANKADIDNGAVSALFLGNLIGDFANVATLIGTAGNVGNILMAGGNMAVSGQINSLGNVVAPFFIGNGSQLTGLLSGLPGSGDIDISGNVTGEYANVANIIAVEGNVGGILLEGGNVSGVYANVGTVFATYGNIGGVFFIDNTVNIGTGGVTMQNGDITIANGNISAQYYTGNGALLTGLLTTLPATANIDIRGNVTGNTIATETIIASANLTVSGRAGVTGNVSTGEYFIGNGYYMTLNGLTLIPQGNVANAAVRLALNVPAGTLVTQTDINTQYLLTALPASSNINWLEFTGTNFPVPSVFGRTGAITAFPNDYNDSLIQLSANIGSAIANVDHVNDALAYLDINKANVVNGNITAGYFLGNGALLTGITSALPSRGNIDINGNVIGAFANVIQVITSNLRVSSNTVSLGLQAGNLTQGLGAIAIGPNAAHLSQGTSAVAIGANAASVNQGSQAIAIGRTAGTTSQGASSIAIGSGAAITSQGASSIAIGVGAAATSQATQTIAIGRSAGSQSQGVQGIALGDQTATISQGIQAIAIGSTAGQSNQGRESIAIGTAAGQTNLGTHSIAIGRNAGGTGGNAITMGHYATADFANSIVISAGGTSIAPVSSPGVGTLTINPIRGNALASSQFLMYNTTTKEVSYNTSGNVSAVYFLGNGALMTGVTASLPTSGNIDIRGNVIGTYANVDQVITSNLSVTSQLVSIGFQAGNSGQGFSSVAIGANAAPLNQGPEAVAIGSNSAYTSQGSYAVAIGRNAGGNSQGVQAVAVGDGAGRLTQGTAAVAVGLTAGTSSQGISGVAVGFSAGRFTQGAQAVAIGDSAGLSGQGTQAIAIGTSAGSSNQGNHSIGIGRLAGGLGSNAIAIGHNAQANLSNSIVISAWGNGGPLYSSGDGTLTIAPIRGNAIASTTMLMYNTTTREVSYNTSGNVSAPFFFGNGALLTGLTATLPSVANLDIRGNVTAPGNITVAGQVNVVGNVSANYFIGNGALLTGVTATLPTIVPADIRGNLIGSFANVANIITVEGNVGNTRFLGGNVAVSGQINTLGNIVAPFLIGNIIATQGNIGNVRLTGGNVTASWIFSSNAGMGPGTSYASYGLFGNVELTQDSIFGCKRLIIAGDTFDSSINGATFRKNNGGTEFGDVRIQGQVVTQGNIVAGGQVNVTGNVVAPFFLGNGALLSGVTPTLPALANIDIRGNVIGAFANVANVIAVQGNIGNTRFLGGNVAVSGQVNVLGNVVAPFFVGNGSRLTGVVADTLPSVITANIIGSISGGALVQGHQLRGNTLYIPDNTLGSFIGTTTFDTAGDIYTNDVQADGNLIARNDIQASFGNIVCNKFVFGNAFFMTGGPPATLPSVANTDIRGNVIGAYANVANIIAVQGNVANVRFVAGNITTPGFVYQGIRSATFTGSGTQAAANTTPNIAVQFPTTVLSTGTLDLTLQNTSTRFINLTSSTRLFQVNASIPIGVADGGVSARTCTSYIQYTSAAGAKVRIAASGDSRPNMNAGNDNGQVLNLGTLITLATNDYFELFANAVTTSSGVVNTALTNPQLAAPTITIVQLN